MSLQSDSQREHIFQVGSQGERHSLGSTQNRGMIEKHSPLESSPSPDSGASSDHLPQLCCLQTSFWKDTWVESGNLEVSFLVLHFCMVPYGKKNLDLEFGCQQLGTSSFLCLFSFFSRVPLVPTKWEALCGCERGDQSVS